MQRRAFGRGLPARETQDPVGSEMARTVRDIRTARMFRELTQDPPGPEEIAQQSVTSAVWERVAQEVMDRMNGGEAKGDALRQAIANAVDNATALKIVREMEGGPAAAVTPNSPADLMALAGASNQFHTNVATTAMARETAARQELSETLAHQEQRVAAARQAATQEGVGYASLLREVLQKGHESETALLKQTNDAAVERLERRFEEMEARHQREMADMQSRHATQLQVAEQQRLADLEKFGMAKEIERLRASVPHTETAEEIMQKGYAREYVQGLGQERQAKANLAEEYTAFVAAAREQLPNAAPLIAQGLALLGAPPASFPGSIPDEAPPRPGTGEAMSSAS